MELSDSQRPLDATALAAELARLGWAGPSPTLVAVTADLRESAGVIAESDAPELTSLVAEATDHHLAGRYLLVATGVDPGGPAGWVPLLTALAAADAIRSACRLPVDTEWPDRLTVPGAMCGGSASPREVGHVGVRSVGGRYAVTVEIRMAVGALDLAPEHTSVFASGGDINRTRVAASLLTHLDRRVNQWRAADSELVDDYRARCATIGRLADGGWISGIDAHGQPTIRY